MRIGGSDGRRRTVTPQQKGMGNRANMRLEHLVSAQNVKHAEALKIDGVDLFIWERNAGAIPCTCTYTQPASEAPVLGTAAPTVDRAVTLASPVTTRGGFSFVDPTASIEERLTVPHDKGLPDEIKTGKQKLEWDGGVDPEASPEDFEFDEGFEGLSDDFTDLEVDDPLLAAIKNVKPGRTGDYIKCPVCYGTGFVDGWQPYKGRRVVLEFSENSNYTLINDADLDLDARPNVLTLLAGQAVQWAVKLPKYFRSVMRIQAWNGRQHVNTGLSLTMENPHLSGSVKVTEKNIAKLESQGGLTLITAKAEEGLRLTHIEIVFMLADMVVGQLPQIEVPYDHDVVDYNTNISIELGADSMVKEGWVICDRKNGRPWRVSAVTRTSTATGQALRIQADCRAVIAKETYFLMNPFSPVEQPVHQHVINSLDPKRPDQQPNTHNPIDPSAPSNDDDWEATEW